MKPWPTVRPGEARTHFQEYSEASEPSLYPKLSRASEVIRQHWRDKNSRQRK